MQKLKDNVRLIAWLSILMSLAGAVISLRYLSPASSFSLEQFAYFFAINWGFGLIILFLLQLLLWTLFGFLSRKWRLGLSLVLSAAVLTAILADTFVYQQYRFHINWPMIDLAINTSGQVIHFSVGMQLEIALLVAGLTALSAFIVWLAVSASRRAGALAVFSLVALCFAGANMAHAFAFASNYRPVTSLSERIPLFHPLRTTNLMRKLGMDHPEAKIDMNLASASAFNYPLEPLAYGSHQQKLNVLILAVDSLRADVVDPKTMPTFNRFAEENIRFADHYSSGNATRAGIFGLFYGLPPLYWKYALGSHIPASLVESFASQGYEVSPFTSASLTRPEFNQTVFANVRPLRLRTKDGPNHERDVNCTADFFRWLESRDKSRPFLSFVFLDSVHGSDFPPDMKVPYPDYWEEVNNLELNADFDPTRYFNRYKNSAYFDDTLIAQILEKLKAEGLWDNTVILLTSDHGEEFNDGKENYWGHNGNFSAAQIRIPLAIRWPGLPSQAVNYRTTAYDVSATLMKRLLDVQNPLEDFTVGKDLFEAGGRDRFIASSYLQDAIIQGGDVLLIKQTGLMEARTLEGWHEEPDEALRRDCLPYYLSMRGKYLK